MYNVGDLAFTQGDFGEPAGGAEVFSDTLESVLKDVTGPAPLTDLKIPLAETDQKLAVIGRPPSTGQND